MITTHVLDTARGRPATGMRVALARVSADGTAQPVGEGTTDADGRLRDLGDPAALGPGRYRLVFHTGAWFATHRITGFYPEVAIDFTVTDVTEHHHVPLLLSPFGYATYRGS